MQVIALPSWSYRLISEGLFETSWVIKVSKEDSKYINEHEYTSSNGCEPPHYLTQLLGFLSLIHLHLVVLQRAQWGMVVHVVNVFNHFVKTQIFVAIITFDFHVIEIAFFELLAENLAEEVEGSMDFI